MACTAPRPFWKVRAPSIEAIIMFQRAGRLAPLVVASWIQPAARSTPSMAMASAGGLTSGER
jgi:hypothetical protein